MKEKRLYSTPTRETLQRSPRTEGKPGILADACLVTVNATNDIFHRGSVLVHDDRIADGNPQ
jgi:hypothetical protein